AAAAELAEGAGEAGAEAPSRMNRCNRAALARTIASVQGVRNHTLRTRRMGPYCLVDVTIIVDARISASAASMIAETLHDRVIVDFRPAVTDVLVHVDPDGSPQSHRLETHAEATSVMDAINPEEVEALVRAALLEELALAVLLVREGMGILRLVPFLRKHCGHVVRPLRPEGLKGRRVWVDVHGPLYRCAYRSPGNSQGKRLEAFGMQPVFVFASAPKPAKVEHTLIERARKRDVQQARGQKALEDLRSILGQLEELGAAHSMQRKYNERCLESHFARHAIAIPADAYQMVKYALTQRGSKVIQARSGDAEEEAAKSSAPEDLVASEDLDALIHEAPSVLRFIDRLGADMEFDPEDVRVPSVINLSEVMAGLGFTKHKQLVDFAILCGCDFAAKLKGIRPIHAHRIILKHGSIGRSRMTAAAKATRDILEGWMPILQED
ncbi:unnamed protein product, partial [Polarella glacialis]